MKSVCLLAALSLLSLSLSVAQTQPSAKPTTNKAAKPASTTATKPTSAVTVRPATKPASTTTTGNKDLTGSATTAVPQAVTTTAVVTTAVVSTTATNPYRQQELYDEHHGITKKPATASAPVAPNRGGTSSRNRRTEPDTKPATSAEGAATTQPATAPPLLSDGSTSRVRIGLRGGVTYPYNFDEAITGDPTISFIGGVVFNFGSGTLSFQPEINYARYAGKASAFGTTITAAFDQIEVPLLLKIASGNANSTRFFVNIGPYASYTLNASINGKTQSLEGVEGRLGFGGAAGVGVALRAGPGHLTIEARGLYSLGNSADGFNTDSKTILGQGTLGYVFPLGGR